MAILNVVLAGAGEIAARSLYARQEDAPTLTPSPSATASRTLTTSESSPTGGIGGSDNNGSFGSERDSSTTSPLLFFVALGFGVVFTNLWIIVGVKYCFRYNARNRQMRMAEEGDPVALENMPRPHRRRREKKLMTMEEVNEKFPMLKYKNWVSARAQEGLPTMGGVSAPPSRANSVRSIEAAAPELPSKERSSDDDQRPTTSKSMAPASSQESPKAVDGAKKDGTNDTTEAGTGGEQSNLQRVESDDEHDNEHINPALPPECMGTSGDACAICIELLEDDDDVRGLTCGHAFHAVCVDPWLTSRRASCPLCKADYYTPKPRPQQTDANGNAIDNTTFADMGRNNSRLNLPSTPQSTWDGIIGRGRRFLPAGLRSEPAPTPQQSQRTRERRRAAGQTSTRSPAQPTPSPRSPEITEARSANNIWSSVGRSLGRFRPQRGNNQPAGQTPVGSGANESVTPSQLESGNRPAATS